MKHECILKMITIFVDNLQFTFVFISLTFFLHNQRVQINFVISHDLLDFPLKSLRCVMKIFHCGTPGYRNMKYFITCGTQHFFQMNNSPREKTTSGLSTLIGREIFPVYKLDILLYIRKYLWNYKYV